jgi:hypothetical protein
MDDPDFDGYKPLREQVASARSRDLHERAAQDRFAASVGRHDGQKSAARPRLARLVWRVVTHAAIRWQSRRGAELRTQERRTDPLG